MRHRTASARGRGTGRARGFVVVLVLVMLVVGSTYAILTGLGTAAAAVRLSRDEATAAALKQAKEGLIAWAATRAADGPGHLPCPDRNLANSAFAGYQDSGCAGAATRIGRLPFRTLSMPDLRDASGERLWYALSANFRDSVIPTSLPVNSDTQGTLNIEGASSASGIVAIIFAPGAAIGNQTRAAADSADVARYLESVNPYLADTFMAATTCVSGACTLPFSGGAPVASAYNDQLIVITHEDLFRVVEAVVQRRMEQEIATGLTNPTDPAGGYFERWGLAIHGDKRRGFFPFAAPYDDPARAQGDYRGELGQINGLLPVSTDVTAWVTWTDIQVDKTNPLAAGTIDSGSPTPACAAGAAGPECTLNYTCDFVDPMCGGGMGLTLTARLRNVAKSLLLPTGITEAGSWTVTTVGATVSGVTPSFDLATGDLLLTVTITVPATLGGSEPATIVFPARTFSAATDPAQWFAKNGWYRQTYYALSDGFRLETAGTREIDPLSAGYATTPPCQPEPVAPACIRVDNGPAKARAVLVLAGRHRAGGARPYTIANYFEAANADVPPTTGAPANQVFERRLRSTDFNDRVVVVAPEPVLP
jgi:hypothetical protein